MISQVWSPGASWSNDHPAVGISQVCCLCHCLIASVLEGTNNQQQGLKFFPVHKCQLRLAKLGHRGWPILSELATERERESLPLCRTPNALSRLDFHFAYPQKLVLRIGPQGARVTRTWLVGTCAALFPLKSLGWLVDQPIGIWDGATNRQSCTALGQCRDLQLF